MLGAKSIIFNQMPAFFILSLLPFTAGATDDSLKFHDSAGSSLPPSVRDNPPEPLDFVPENYSPYVPKIVPGQFLGMIMVPPSAPAYRPDVRDSPYLPAYPGIPTYPKFPKVNPYLLPN